MALRIGQGRRSNGNWILLWRALAAEELIIISPLWRIGGHNPKRKIMNKYGQEALNNWETLAPSKLAAIANPEEYFQELGEQAANQVLDLMMELAGPDLDGETYFQKVGRLQQAKLAAQEIVSKELLTPPASQWEIDEEEFDREGEIEFKTDAWLSSLNRELIDYKEYSLGDGRWLTFEYPNDPGRSEATWRAWMSLDESMRARLKEWTLRDEYRLHTPGQGSVVISEAQVDEILKPIARRLATEQLDQELAKHPEWYI